MSVSQGHQEPNPKLDGETAQVAVRAGDRFALAVFGISAAALLATIVLLTGIGSGARHVDAVMATSETAPQVVEAARQMNAHGTVMLVATADLGYASLVATPAPEALKWPVRETDYAAQMMAATTRDTWAYVLARIGVARRIDYVLPQGVYGAKVEAGLAGGFPGIAADRSHIVANDEGYLRYISTRPMKLGSPLLLVVDASYFQQGTSEELIASLKQMPLLPSAVIIYRASDAPDVTDEARKALDEAVPQLEEALQL